MLKKIIMLLVVVAMQLGVALAADSTSYTTYTDVGTVFTTAGIGFKSSTNVLVYYKNDGITPKSQLYTIGSKNTSGDTIYATSNMSANIYKRKDADNSTKAGVTLTSLTSKLPTAAGESTGWSSDWSPL